jgi:hypothetical protein
MGWISKRHMQTGGSIGGRRKKSYPKDGAPLRKVVGVIVPSESMFVPNQVLLECGHEDYSWGGLRARCSSCKPTSV